MDLRPASPPPLGLRVLPNLCLFGAMPFSDGIVETNVQGDGRYAPSTLRIQRPKEARLSAGLAALGTLLKHCRQ